VDQAQVVPESVDGAVPIAIEHIREGAASLVIKVEGHFGGGLDGLGMPKPADEKLGKEAVCAMGEVDTGSVKDSGGRLGTDGMTGDAGKAA
jgi:hypothetical protein